MKQKNSYIWIQIHLAISGAAIFLFSTFAQALPILDSNKFFASSTLFQPTGWIYTGTLPGSLDAGFRARNRDPDLVGDSGTQYATGRRRVSVTTGSNPSYTLEFRGEFEAKDSEAWTSSLLDQSKGVRQVDINKVTFSNIDSGITLEHPIPVNWQSLNGYKNPAGGFAKFDNTFSLSRKYLEPGEFGCPLNSGHCAYTGAYFKGGVNLQANLQGYASVENPYPFFTQSVTIDAKANRITTFKVNSDPLYSGEITGNHSIFNLEEDKVQSLDFSFTANFREQSVSVGTDVQWDARDETASFDASYVHRVDMPDYVNVGSTDSFLVEVRDDLQLSAGLTGTKFEKAKVLASTSISAIDALFLPVFEPLASGRLVVKDASFFNVKNRYLPIPHGGFTKDLPFYLHFLLANEGSMDLTVDWLNFSLFDEDFFLFSRDDILASINGKQTDWLIRPGVSQSFTVFLPVSVAQLEAADDFLEGPFLELAGLGSFGFHDIYGSRTVNFDLNISEIPEPDTISLLLIAFASIVLSIRFKSSRRRKNLLSCNAIF